VILKAVVSGKEYTNYSGVDIRQAYSAPGVMSFFKNTTISDKQFVANALWCHKDGVLEYKILAQTGSTPSLNSVQVAGLDKVPLVIPGSHLLSPIVLTQPTVRVAQTKKKKNLRNAVPCTLRPKDLSNVSDNVVETVLTSLEVVIEVVRVVASFAAALGFLLDEDNNAEDYEVV